MARAARLLRLLTLIESIAAAAAYALVAAVLIADVAGREVLGSGVFGAQKMAVYGAVIAAFLGLSLSTASNTHLRPAFLDHVLRGPMVDRFGDALSAAFFLAVAWFGVSFVLQSMEFQDRAAVLYWLLWPIQIVIPYALISTALRHAAFAIWPDLKPKPEAPA